MNNLKITVTFFRYGFQIVEIFFFATNKSGENFGWTSLRPGNADRRVDIFFPEAIMTHLHIPCHLYYIIIGTHVILLGHSYILHCILFSHTNECVSVFLRATKMVEEE